ncbi:MAG TPA: hypothetical protein DCZ92_09255 [Elusimicrobia bacterium]|nr:MAG: hypothetical protein A2016_05770 [Elusimicrobia bacterium GWF2_62_30]HBA60990.1 hypothetical protein [Elusimicrobiota bacterium]
MIKNLLFLLVLVLQAAPVLAGPFVYDAGVNARIAEKLDIPVFYTFPDTAFAPDPVKPGALEGLYEFRHPASAAAAKTTGLHVYATRRQNVAARLAASGLVQTGDIILTFRPEWAFRGPYPNVQMGVSHAGLAFVENGTVLNLDTPMTDEYLGPMSAAHYKEAAALHIVRPRGLTKEQRGNLLGWAQKLYKRAAALYPAQISFNQNYFEPKYASDPAFASTLGRIALQLDKTAKLDIYCSEFVWAILSLKGCDPAQPEAFAAPGSPACVKQPFAPLQMTGDYFSGPGPAMGRLGLSDGPLAVISALGLPAEAKRQLIHEVFETKRPLDNMSPGHRAVAERLAPFFAPLENYYAGIEAGAPAALQTANAFNSSVKANYSPTAFLVNTLLPPASEERKLDVVATVLFMD